MLEHNLFVLVSNKCGLTFQILTKIIISSLGDLFLMLWFKIIVKSKMRMNLLIKRAMLFVYPSFVLVLIDNTII